MNTQDKDTLRLGIPSELADAAKLCETAAGITDRTLREELINKARAILRDCCGQMFFIRNRDREELKEGTQ